MSQIDFSPAVINRVEPSRMIGPKPRGRLTRWFAPRIIRLCPTCGGGMATQEVSVTLPQMVAHRAAQCKACEHRVGPLCRRCGCVLFIKQRIAAAACPEGKW